MKAVIIYNGKKITFSISGDGKTGQLHIKETIPFFHATYKRKVKIN